MSVVRGAIELLKALQQSGNHGQVPFAASWRWYPSLVQLVPDGLDGDKTRFAKFTNCRTTSLGSHVSGPLDRQPHAPKHPHYSGKMPASAKGSRYSSSVQLTRQLTLGNKPAAMSCRMVKAKAAARESAARLLPEGLCLPRLRGAVPPWVNSIGPSRPHFDGPASQGISVNIVSRGSTMAESAASERPAQTAYKPGRAFNLPVHPRSGRATTTV
jgi:hypothetical protein